MTVRRSENGTIVLDGACPVEDAEALLQLLQATPTSERSTGHSAVSYIRRYFRWSWHRAVARWPVWRCLGSRWLAPKLPKGNGGI